MGILDAIKICFSKFATFSGRARRREYWFFYLGNTLINLLLFILGAVTGSGIFFVILGIYNVAIIIPGLAVLVRRLHDTNRSGANVLWVLLPLVGEIILLVFLFSGGTPGANNYGDDPKAQEA